MKSDQPSRVPANLICQTRIPRQLQAHSWKNHKYHDDYLLCRQQIKEAEISYLLLQDAVYQFPPTWVIPLSSPSRPCHHAQINWFLSESSLCIIIYQVFLSIKTLFHIYIFPNQIWDFIPESNYSQLPLSCIVYLIWSRDSLTSYWYLKVLLKCVKISKRGKYWMVIRLAPRWDVCFWLSRHTRQKLINIQIGGSVIALRLSLSLYVRHHFHSDTSDPDQRRLQMSR